ncbi:MAG: IS200/IS605 family accessory protein TnpB-related protein [Cupriavidus sp.]|nr:IS200/IS605 family accessory protein TnpB-related protein [Cupriavidus sp.]
MFNAIRIGLDGKVRSIQERRPDSIKELAQRITKAKTTITKLRSILTGTEEQRTKRAAKIHQKQRRLAILEQKRATLLADQKDGKVRICFGSRKLFRAQFDLSANGYTNHEEWKADWRSARASEFMVVGSKDETAGNQSCQLRSTACGQFSLKLRLPNAIGKTIEFPITLPHGEAQIMEALTLNQALTYRFVRDPKGWRVLISTDIAERTKITSCQTGNVGVDINADHLAIAELDRHGNIIDTQRISLCTYGKTKSQSMAIIGDACKEVIARAVATGKPIALENLDFAKKKAGLEGQPARYARMLSGFSYSKIVQTLKARAFDAGIEVLAVNPACTSIIGRHKFATRYGISNHQAAAAVIGRRATHLSESPNRRFGDQVTFAVPVRNRAKHVWSYWREVAQKEAAHAARSRLAQRSAGQSKVARTPPALRPDRDLPVESRYASSQHCSVSAIDITLDVPC